MKLWRPFEEWPADSSVVWADHVLFDIPETTAAAIRNARPEIVRFTIAEPVARLINSRYALVVKEAERRQAELYVALNGSFDRVPLQDYLQA